jgi:transposase
MWQNKSMRAYSQDLRQCILRAVDQGQPRAEIIKTFAVSRSTIKHSLKLRRETGNVKPKAIPGRPSKKGAALHTGLLPQLAAHPDATLVEYCQLWEAMHGIQVSSATMSRAIRRLNWTRKKKTLRASEQSEADRVAWREQAKTLDESLLVFIDECGSNIALTRLYVRSPKGERVYGQFHAIGEPISRCWLRSRWKAQRIPLCLNSTLSRSWLQVYQPDTLSSWTICVRIVEQRCDTPPSHGGANFSFCPPTLPTYRQLKKPSPS